MDTNMHFYRRSYRRAPSKLVPSIIWCQSSGCLLFFSVFLLISGSMLRFFAGDDSPPSPAFDKPFFNESRKEFAKTPRIIGTVLLSIGVVLTLLSITGFMIAFVLYRNYERERRIGMLSNTGSQAYSSQAFVPSPNAGVDYPTHGGYHYDNGYRVVAQNVVYNPTTEPNQSILQS